MVFLSKPYPDPKSGRFPVVFDILSPDLQTSMLPEGLRLVMHATPQNFTISYTKVQETLQTKGGWVEYPWGLAPTEVTMSGVTGGFVRLYAGVVGNSAPVPSSSQVKGSGTTPVPNRRETLAYQDFLDLLALYKSNGAIYDQNGSLAYQGRVALIYDNATFYGNFSDFSFEDSADKAYQFSFNISFTVDQEIWSVSGLRR